MKAFGKDIRIATAVVQCAVGRIEQNLSGMRRWVRAAREQKAAVICFPEMNVTGYLNRGKIEAWAEPVPGPITRSLVRMAEEERIVILAGMAEKGPRGEIYASHLVVNPDGTVAAYRKLHIAPVERSTFSPGNDIPLFELGELKFGIQLCYDAHFPELTTRMALAGAAVIFIPHASPRGTPPEKLASWLRHLPARAYDNSLFIVACNQTGSEGEGLTFPGLSVVIDPAGRIVEKDTSGREGVMIADLKADSLLEVRKHPMRFFLPNRRPELYAERLTFPQD